MIAPRRNASKHIAGVVRRSPIDVLLIEDNNLAIYAMRRLAAVRARLMVKTWNARQEAHMPMLFSPTIGAAIAARHWFLWARCPACRTMSSIDLRALDHHPDAAVTSLIPALSCRSCRPHAPFAELVRLSGSSVAGALNVSRNQMIIG
jgi:hypothetical protein